MEAPSVCVSYTAGAKRPLCWSGRPLALPGPSASVRPSGRPGRRPAPTRTPSGPGGCGEAGRPEWGASGATAGRAGPGGSPEPLSPVGFGGSGCPRLWEWARVQGPRPPPPRSCLLPLRRPPPPPTPTPISLRRLRPPGESPLPPGPARGPLEVLSGGPTPTFPRILARRRREPSPPCSPAAGCVHVQGPLCPHAACSLGPSSRGPRGSAMGPVQPARCRLRQDRRNPRS